MNKIITINREMKHCLVILLCFLLGQIVVSSKSVSVEKTCKNVMKVTDPDWYDFCVTAFHAVPESRTVDLAGLVLIGTQLTKENHTRISQKAKDLLTQSGWSHGMEQSLLTCLEVHDLSVVHLDAAMAYLKERKYEEFTNQMEIVNTMSVTCDDTFNEMGEKNLLEKENDAAFELGEITHAMGMLLQN